MLPVSEVFYSIQGEGATMGRPSIFLRLQACNLMCGGMGTEKDGELHDGATWRCDTIEVWLKGTKKEFDKILSQDFVRALSNGAHLIITGGEPLLHQAKIIQFLAWFEDAYGFLPFTEIETNGTIPVQAELIPYVDQWNVSPKLANSGMPYKRRFSRLVLDQLNGLSTSIFKFVISDKKDWYEIQKDFINMNVVQRNKVWLMPACSNISQLLKMNQLVAEIALAEQLNFSTRLQVEIWDKTTGV